MERELQFRRADGLFANILSQIHQNYTTRHIYLLLKGNRKTVKTVKISVEFQFTTQFLADIGLDNNKVTNLIAVRTINVKISLLLPFF